MKLILIIAVMLLIGCTSIQTYLEVGSKKAADAMDIAVDNAVYFLCGPASIRSLNKKFGKNEKIKEAYKILCKEYSNSASVL